MAPILHQITAHISRLVVSQFLFVWMILLVGIFFSGLVVRRPRGGSGAAGAEAEGESRIWPSRLSARLAKIAVLIFLSACAVLTLFRDELRNYDSALLWLVLLLLIAFCALAGSDGGHPKYSQPPQEETRAEQGTFAWPESPADRIAAVAFLIFLTGYIALIFYRPDFAWYDDEVFTDFSLQGKNFAPAIWPGQGRFFPLEVQEFNYLSRITRSAAGFHAFAVAQLLILLAALVAVLKEYKIWQRALLLIAVMLAPSFLISYTGLIYPERNVLFWLAVLVLCLDGYSRTRGAIYLLGCLAATHCALYYKEPMAIFVAGFAVTRLLLENHAKRGASRSWREPAGENLISLGMLAITGIFVCLFVLALFPRASGSYVEARHMSPGAVLWAYAQTDWLLIVLLAAFGVRLARFLLWDGELDPLWEPLAVGALGYFFAVLALGLYSGYYTAPVDLIAVLYAGRMGLAWVRKPTQARVLAVAAVFVILMLHNAAYSAFRMVETKSLIAVKAQFADYLESHAKGTDTIELYFPYASRFHLMGISAYLKHRGMRIAGQKGTSIAAGPRVVIEGAGEYPINRCVEYRTYTCVHVDEPREGAWIVVMPDDDASMEDVERAGRGSELAYQVKTCGMCERKGSWFRRLHAISQEFWNRPLPGHWLELHIFKKQPAVARDGIERTRIAGTDGGRASPQPTK